MAAPRARDGSSYVAARPWRYNGSAHIPGCLRYGGGIGAPELGSTTWDDIPAGAVYVSPTGSDSAAGTYAAPKATIAAAVSATIGGQTIALHDGTYRDSLVTLTDETRRLVAVPGAVVRWKGSEVYTTWTTETGRWYTGSVGNVSRVLQSANTSEIHTSWPYAAWPTVVLRDGVSLTQVGSLGEGGPGKFFHDTVARRVYVWDDPTASTMEIATRGQAIRFTSSGSRLNTSHQVTTPLVTGGAVIGISFEGWATQFTQGQFGVVNVNGQAGFTMDRCHFADIALAAVAFTDVEACAVLRTTITRPGYQGITANWATNLTIERCAIHDANYRRFRSPASGAIKLHRTRTASINDCLVDTTYGPELGAGKGIWLDLGCVDVVIVRGFVADTYGHGIMVEVSGDVVVAGNVVNNAGSNGVYVLESAYVDVWNNLILDWARRESARAVAVLEGSRVTTAYTALDMDARFPYPNPRCDMQVRSPRVYNNVFGLSNSLATNSYVYGVADTGASRSTTDMGAEFDGNRTWRANGTAATTWLAVMANYPTSQGVCSTLTDLQARGFETSGTAVDGGNNPYVVNAVTKQWVTPAAHTGVAIPDRVAMLIGVAPGSTMVGVPSVMNGRG